MDSKEYQTPDLASVLRTLASLAPPEQQRVGIDPAIPQAPLLSHQAPSQSSFTPPLQGSYSQGSTTSSYPPQAQILPPHSGQQAWSQQREYGQQGLPRPHQAKNVIDPATIIEWSAGLRCIMKTISKNETIIQEIQRMIKIQHDHEEQWWNGRKALIERQAARKEGKRKLDEVLKAVGGITSGGTSSDDPEALARELETFDMKVYKAQMQMVREMTSRLRNLGVPFFGTRTDLVRPVGKEAPPGSGRVQNDKAVIDELDLVKLQRKMLALLEDLGTD